MKVKLTTLIIVFLLYLVLAPIGSAYNGSAPYDWGPGVPNYDPAAIVDAGVIPTDNLFLGDFIGISPAQPNAPGWGDSGAVVGWDDSFVMWAGSGNTNGDALDGTWVQLEYPAEGWWDLGSAFNRVAIFTSQDHGPYLAEGLEYRVFGSNTLWGGVSTQAVLKEVYVDGWRLHNPAEDWNGNGWTSDDVVRCV